MIPRRMNSQKTTVLLCALFFALSAAASPKPDAPDAATAARIQRIENGIAPISLGPGEAPLQINLEKLMEVYKVPGFSVAVVDNFKIAWAKAYGVTEAGGHTPVTVHTLFQAGSISKPVAATGTLYLVEHGKLSLDENVNDKLKSWKVPDNEFTKDQKVTLRRIMSHSAGLTVHGFPGYEVGKPVPTLVQVLNGEPPANTAPVRVEFVPGSKQNYSGGGVTIEQLLVTDVTGEPFPEFMRKTVLAKIGMNESTYEQPIPAAWASRTASGTRGDGTVVPGKWHIYPEMAAAGLWTTPTDLAKWGIEIALSKQGNANHVLSESMTKQMLTPQSEEAGLGPFLKQGGNPDAFGHNGADEGFQAELVTFADTGKGAVMMMNSDNGLSMSSFLGPAIAKEYGWNFDSHPGAFDVLWLVANVRDTAAMIKKYEEMKQSSPKELDENVLLQIAYRLLFAGKTDEALRVFKLQVRDYPNYWNSYDSIGEAYMKAGQRDLAIQNYEKSIELNPKNQNGIDMLKKLKQ